MSFINVNGKIVAADQPVLMADNKSYRYGDGLFETIKVVRNKISLEAFHFRRFFSGLQQLQFDTPPHVTPEALSTAILMLCRKNKCEDLARVRLSAFRGNGGLNSDDTPGFIIECWPVPGEVNEWNSKGLEIGIYSQARKSCDAFSSLKSANYLPYVMASLWSRQQGYDDSLVLNSHDRIAETTIANVFIINGNIILTPSLGEGCVNGVIRQYLLEQLPAAGYTVKEQPLTVAQVLEADEFFLTNALQGIRWVEQCGKKIYEHSQAMKIYRQLVQTIWQ